MDFSEKLIALRKSRNLTQEQLAEKLNVSRQSVSKWESGQVIPDAEKLVEVSKIFDVSLDTLLKPSELDELSLKTDLLARQQHQLLAREQQRAKVYRNILYSVVIYLVFFALLFAEHYFFFAMKMELYGKPVIFAEFLLATALVLFVWTRSCFRRS